MHRTWDTIPLHSLYKGTSKIATFVEWRVFRGTLPRNDATFLGVFCINLIESKVLYNVLKKFRGCAFRFWSYSNSNIGDRDVCAQIYCENF